MADVQGVYTERVSNNAKVNIKNQIPTEKRVRDITQEIIDATQTISLQVVAAEVVDVVTDPLSAKLPPSYQGCIRVDTGGVDFALLPENSKGYVKPLSAFVNQYPVLGEFVSLINLGGYTFYFNPINFLNSPNNNMLKGLTSNPEDGIIDDKKAAASVGEFEPVIGGAPRPVQVYPGDFAINGRNEQSIRIGKTKGSKKDSVIKLRISSEDSNIGNLLVPNEEDVNLDLSSIYMTRSEEIPLNIVPFAQEITKDPLVGSQILLDSKTITFNSKEGGDIRVYSGRNINIVGKGTANIVGLSVNIGDNLDANLQPGVLGDQLVKFLVNVLNQLNSFGAACAAATGTGNFGIPVPVFNVMSAGAGLQSGTAVWTESVLKDFLLSKNVKISRAGKANL
tara:strand:- start:19240 stop:20421 length:1182 start_codon:yes stop_codon:yes gene_type:complete